MSEHHDLGLRRLLSRAGVFAVLLAAGLLVAACGSSKSGSSTGAGSTAASSGSSGSGAKSLKILTWETYHDKAWLDEFKQKTGITVQATNVGSPAEMFAKVKANPSQFDIVLATAGWFKNYVEAGLLEPVDLSKAPNAANIQLGFPWKDATS